MFPDTLHDLVGTTLGGYKLLDVLGEGAMSVVFRAVSSDSGNRHVAIKVLKPELASDREAVERFLDEANHVKQLKHVNIVPVIDAGADRGYYYMVMELREGRSLASIMRDGQPLPASRRNRILYQLAAAIDFAHAHGFIHRDIKPGNVIIGPNDHVTLLDFGLIKALDRPGITQVGTKMGTPEYMSPEQAGAKRVGPATDIYSLGVVAYQLMTGRVPFTAENSHAVLYQQIHEPPQPPRNVTSSEQTAVLRALHKDPASRWRSAGEFVDVLRKQSKRPEPTRNGPKPLVPLLAIGAAMALLATVIFLGDFASSDPDDPTEPALPLATDTPPPMPTSVERSLETVASEPTEAEQRQTLEPTETSEPQPTAAKPPSPLPPPPVQTATVPLPPREPTTTPVPPIVELAAPQLWADKNPLEPDDLCAGVQWNAPGYVSCALQEGDGRRDPKGITGHQTNICFPEEEKIVRLYCMSPSGEERRVEIRIVRRGDD